jgi:hypothetical protein
MHLTPLIIVKFPWHVKVLAFTTACYQGDHMFSKALYPCA